MEILPKDVLILILKKIDNVKSLAKFIRTCKYINSLPRDRRIWEPLLMKEFPVTYERTKRFLVSEVDKDYHKKLFKQLYVRRNKGFRLK
jgi:hypothetical protein